MRIRTLTMTIAAAAALMVAAPAQAQFGRNWPDSRGYGNSNRIAYDNGYREGLSHGEKAARDRRPFDLNREKDYRNADEGYRREYGNKDRYRDDFRRGFSEGYRQSYERYGNGGYYGNGRRDDGRAYPRTYPQQYPNNYPVYGGPYGGYRASPAFDNGLRDGYDKGRNDARDGKYPDVTRQKWYRSGDRDYRGEYGSRDSYRLDYRRGFEEGYRRAYGEGRRW